MIKGEKTYRLEFNEERQRLRLDNGSHKPNTHGWVTILAHCTDTEFEILESYLSAVENLKWTKDYILKCEKEITALLKNLSDYGLVIRKP